MATQIIRSVRAPMGYPLLGNIHPRSRVPKVLEDSILRSSQPAAIAARVRYGWLWLEASALTVATSAETGEK
jgi:hypothetical protein